jgi:hypothetical protein
MYLCDMSVARGVYTRGLSGHAGWLILKLAEELSRHLKNRRQDRRRYQVCPASGVELFMKIRGLTAHPNRPGGLSYLPGVVG